MSEVQRVAPAREAGEAVRLYDRVLAEGALWTPAPGVIASDRSYPGGRDAFASIRVKVTADDVLATYWSSTRDSWHMSDMGCLRAPFDSLWIEGRLPIRSYATDPSGRLVERFTRGHSEGCVVFDASEQEGRPCTGLVHLMPSDDGTPLANPAASFLINLDDDGRAVGGISVLVNEAWAAWLDEAGQDPNTLAPTSLIFALGLMNCRNIGVEPVVVEEKLKKAHRKRYGVPMSRYSKIVLPSSMRASSGGTGSEGKAHHLVRGHFKTFTADAPLMGQHVGTYWWGWHGRGDPDLGEITPTYEVRTP